MLRFLFQCGINLFPRAPRNPEGYNYPSDGNQFQEALFRELIRGESHTFQSTDLAGTNEMDIIFNISGYELIGTPPRMLETIGEDGKKILINGGSYARFDFILGYMFIQVSVSSFTVHNDPTGSVYIDKAFSKREATGKNQIEEYLDAAFGGVHQATMTEEPADDENDNIASNDKRKGNKSNRGNRGRGNNQSDGKGTNAGIKKRKGNDESSDNNKNDEGSSKKRKTVKKFAVTRDGKPCNDFQIVYICGGNKADKNAGSPNHTGKVIEYPQIRHICYDELKSKLFRAYMS
ncbi:hypothetical protein BCR41DRAFT_74141 [Lobosporangium transversale]|uniref:Uncharacterized protein n=1 Tax=Lobosporangium transversale TaxID=64571 RepID=A0A1Y2H1L6_9FUNG|nr:hypothetical protein BCR41DRAFT_74141 [Lobosporangium transversale]ORZ28448.1 hypothetical protein BCR41DRAFT_74141 [Lobosporangium transversale]|eukprot:XP_021886133.1 hypothetical protein BCR41DRAFT_74141 [Lobosporangium transversale]